MDCAEESFLAWNPAEKAAPCAEMISPLSFVSLQVHSQFG